MPPEGSKQIEDLLHRYAEHRAANAGPPLELHPATRRLLQSEVARHYATAAPVTRASWAAILGAFWRRFAYAGASVALAALAAVWIWISLGPQTERPWALARNEERVNAPASTRPMNPQIARSLRMDSDALSLGREVASGVAKDTETETTRTKMAPQPARTVAEAERLAEKRFGERNVAALAPAPLAAPAAPAAPAPVAAVAPESPASVVTLARSQAEPARDFQYRVTEQRADAQKSELALRDNLIEQKAGATALAGNDLSTAGGIVGGAGGRGRAGGFGGGGGAVANPAPAAKPMDALAVNGSAAATGLVLRAPAKVLESGVAGRSDQFGLVFARANPAGEFVLAKEKATQPAVLTQFEVQRRGERIQILDSDGSAYEGSLLSAAESLQRNSVGVRRESFRASKTAETLDKKPAEPLAGAQTVTLPAAPLEFQVSGTNRSSGQRVVLRGTITGDAGEVWLSQDLRQNAPPPSGPVGQASPGIVPVPASPVPTQAGRTSFAAASPTAVGDRVAGARPQDNLRLEGQLRIGNGPEQPFQAFRKTP